MDPKLRCFPFFVSRHGTADLAGGGFGLVPLADVLDLRGAEPPPGGAFGDVLRAARGPGGGTGGRATEDRGPSLQVVWHL